MASDHLRIQHGGDPAQGPPRDIANEPVAPQDSADFPDIPSGNRPSVGDRGGSDGGRSDLSGEQLDDFAARLGLADREEPADDDSGADDSGGDDFGADDAGAHDSGSRSVRATASVATGTIRSWLAVALDRSGNWLIVAGRRVDARTGR